MRTGGEGNGHATLSGFGTVYPAIFGGLISVVTSGIVTGSGRVVGCGSLVGFSPFNLYVELYISGKVS